MLAQIRDQPLKGKALQIAGDAVGGQDDQALMVRIGKGKHLIASLWIITLASIGQTCRITVMSVGYDAAPGVHHVDNPLYVFGGEYREEPVLHVLLVDEIDKGLGGQNPLDDLIGDSLLVFVEHENQAEVCRSRSFEVEPVYQRLVEDLFVRLDNLAELFELRQCYERQALKARAGPIEILDIRVDGLFSVLFQRALLYPFAQTSGGPGVLVVLAVVGGGGLALDYAHDIVLALAIELLLLGGADHIIRRSDAIAYVANNAAIDKP